MKPPPLQEGDAVQGSALVEVLAEDGVLYLSGHVHNGDLLAKLHDRLVLSLGSLPHYGGVDLVPGRIKNVNLAIPDHKLVLQSLLHEHNFLVEVPESTLHF